MYNGSNNGVDAAIFGNGGCAYANWNWVGYNTSNENSNSFRFCPVAFREKGLPGFGGPFYFPSRFPMSGRPLDFDTGAETLYTFQNLYRAYLEARSRKRGTMNVLRFEYALERNLSDLLATLRDGTYRPNRGVCFVVTRPVIREVFAADFRDRVVHHLYVRSLEKFFEASLDPDSYACRKGKGTVAASDRLASFIRKATENRTREAYCLKLDVAGFFTNIPRDRLLSRLKERIARSEMSDGVRRELLSLSETFCFHDPTKEFAFRGERWLLDTVPRKKSLFHAPEGCGIPIGNLTSQFFANVYLDDLDRYVKRVLRIRHYARYVDDFVLLSESKETLSAAVPKIRDFLKERLGLTLHPKKISLQNVRRWVRFVGYFHRFGIRLALRRNLNAINEAVRERPENLARLSSYLGYLKHSDNGKTYRALAGILSHRVSVASDIGRGGFSFSEAVLVSASVLSLLAVAFLWISRGTGTFSGSAVPSVPIASSVPAVFSVPPVPAFPASGCPVERVAETVNGASMEPLVANGTELTLLSGHYRCHAPEKGDLVAYRYAGRKNPLVKIVRATDADVLAWGQSGTLLVNGSVMANSADVPYSFSEKEIRLLSQYFPKGRIPEGSVLIFGDSVSASVDSRNFGAVGKGDLMGKFVWPR